MPTRNPQLGSLALQGPSAETQTIRVTAATCQDLSLFKSILKEYRKLDDGITMRLNRANALIRDEERERGSTGGESVQNQACASVLKELLDNWKRRTQLINYCVSIHDENLATNKKTEREAVSPSDQRKAQAAAFSDEVKGNQIRNEKTVERIVRKRAVDGRRRTRVAMKASDIAGIPAGLEEEVHLVASYSSTVSFHPGLMLKSRTLAIDYERQALEIPTSY